MWEEKAHSQAESDDKERDHFDDIQETPFIDTYLEEISIIAE
jgi:hypothetical protein